MTQKDAVFSAVTQILASNNVSFQSGSTDVSTLLTRELRAQINTRLETDFRSGSVEMSDDAKSKLNDTAELRAYISGLVSNWVRKDPRLNGGTTVATTSTTTVSAKTLRNDAQLKALRAFLSAQVDPLRRQEIQGYIDQRIAELSKKDVGSGS